MTWVKAKEEMRTGKRVRRDCFMEWCYIHLDGSKKRVWQDGRTYRTTRADRGAADWQVVE
jgi:hypothetical protein